MTNNRTGDIFRELCKVLGYSKTLVQYWRDNKPQTVDQLIAMAEVLSKTDIDIEQLQLALDDWHISDWRGIKGERPSIEQYGEHTLLWFEKWKQNKDMLEELNKSQPWYKAQGMSKREIDAILWQMEASRDKRWGSYCT